MTNPKGVLVPSNKAPTVTLPPVRNDETLRCGVGGDSVKQVGLTRDVKSSHDKGRAGPLGKETEVLAAWGGEQGWDRDSLLLFYFTVINYFEFHLRLMYYLIKIRN